MAPVSLCKLPINLEEAQHLFLYFTGCPNQTICLPKFHFPNKCGHTNLVKWDLVCRFAYFPPLSLCPILSYFFLFPSVSKIKNLCEFLFFSFKKLPNSRRITYFACSMNATYYNVPIQNLTEENIISSVFVKKTHKLSTLVQDCMLQVHKRSII